MKKFLLICLVVLALVSLVACGNKEEVPTQEGENNPTQEPTNSPDEVIRLTNEEMYGGLIKEYQDVIESFDLDDLEAEENLPDVVSDTLIMHIARYAQNGVKLTYTFYDIDHNDTDELLVGADNGLGAIYTFDNETKEPVAIAFQSTLERGNMAVYDNGVILMEGAGGAALHYYEFGKIGTDGKSYQRMEYIQEEYTEGSVTPTYTNAETKEILAYQSLDEIMNKYVENAKEYEFSGVKE